MNWVSTLKKFIVVSTSIFLISSCSDRSAPSTPSSSALPPTNPFLADVHNNQGHWNDAGTDSTDLATPRGHYEITNGSYEIVPNDNLGIPAYTAEVAGKRVHWFYAGTSMRKLLWADGKFTEIDRQDIPQPFENYSSVDPETRLQQASDIEGILEQQDEQVLADYLSSTPNRLLSAVEDQVRAGVLYSLFTRDHALIGSNARGLIRIGNEDPNDPMSKLAPAFTKTLPDSLFDDERVARLTIFQSDVVFGLSMTFNGYLVLNTVGGRLVTLERETFEIIDTYQTKGEDELFTNSFATSGEINGGAIYVASNRKMYRLIVMPNGQISDKPEDGAWHANYDYGERLPYGKIADGTGATPTLMGFGDDDDQLVILTDGAPKMRLVAFWRNEIPGDARQKSTGIDPRIADQIAVDMGDNIEWVQSEQSVVAHGRHAFVVNGVPPERAAPYLVRGSYNRGLLLGTMREPPFGAAMYEWNSRENSWTQNWVRSDVAVLATVPYISSASNMVVVNGYFKNRLREGYHLGLDLGTGETVMSIASGANPLFNGTFTGVKCDHVGTLMYTTMFGLVRFDVEKMKQVEQPDL